MGADASQENTKPERLGDVIICTRFKTKNGVTVAVGTCQHNHGCFQTAFAHQPTRFATIHVRQAHIQQHDVYVVPAHMLNSSRRTRNRRAGEFFVQSKLFDQRGAKCFIIIDQ